MELANKLIEKINSEIKPNFDEAPDRGSFESVDI